MPWSEKRKKKQVTHKKSKLLKDWFKCWTNCFVRRILDLVNNKMPIYVSRFTFSTEPTLKEKALDRLKWVFSEWLIFRSSKWEWLKSFLERLFLLQWMLSFDNLFLVIWSMNNQLIYTFFGWTISLAGEMTRNDSYLGWQCKGNCNSICGSRYW